MTEDWIRFIFIEWGVLFLCLLPRYFIQKKKNPYKRDTFRWQDYAWEVA